MTTATLPGLYPDHLAYLRARGVTDETIAAAGLHTARPGDLSRLAGRPVPEGVSALVIPYPNAPDFCRVRLFPPIPRADGKLQKFGQPQGTGVRAYIPPELGPVLSDTSACLALTEGEVKALALTQAGFACIGLGGVWNFRTKDLPRDGMISDLEAIPWAGRIVRLVPDSDAWHNEQVLSAVFTLARLLEDRGATVLVVKLPTLPHQEKTGADDYLVAKGSSAIRRLVERAVTLGLPAFKPFREQEKAKARSEKVSQPVPAALAGRRLHPALHLDPDGFASVGIVTVGTDGKEAAEIITSGRERFAASAIGPALAGLPLAYPDLVDRWRPADVKRFLTGADSPPTFAKAVGLAWSVLDELLEVGRDCEATLLATWALATYFHAAFLAFPRLDLRGERGSGKSKALDIMAAIAFNGVLYASPSTAVLYRLAHPLRPTLCLDEIEGFDHEERREILAILNRGYTAGGSVPRCEGDDHAVKSWKIYCPVALAGIQGLNRVTEDRAITLVLARGKDPAKLNADVDPQDPRFAETRDMAYRLALLRSREVAETYQTTVLPDWLVGRERQLWRPLLAVAALADRDAPELGLVADLLTLAQEQGEERAGLSDEAGALVTVLSERLSGATEIVVSPGDLCEPLKVALKLDRAPSPQRVGRWMKRLGFPPAPRSAGGKRRLVTAHALADLRRRYGGT